MKKILLVVFSGFLPFIATAQLQAVNILSYPCILIPGLTGVIIANSVPGATNYEWVSNIGNVNTVWFPNIPGPVTTSSPTVTIYANGPSPVYEICVRALNATDTSIWTCVQIMGTVDAPVMSSSNNPVGIPGDSGIYSVVYPSLCPPASYSWTINGSAYFNNISQYVNTTASSVNLNFGPNFTSGTLCVWAVNSLGLTSATVCMTITAPTGLEESNSGISNFIFQQENGQLHLEFNSTMSDQIALDLFDVTGRQLFSEKLNVNPGINHFSSSLAVIPEGIYFLQLSGKNYHESFKLFIRN